MINSLPPVCSHAIRTILMVWVRITLGFQPRVIRTQTINIFSYCMNKQGITNSISSVWYYRFLFGSKPRLLNLIRKVAHGRSHCKTTNTEYTKSIGASWEKLPKIVKITLLQFNYEFSHGNFFTVWSSQYFQIFIDGKNSYRRKLS